MAYTVRLHPKADEDFIQAYAWYEKRQEGLGEKFISAIKARIQDITDHPEAFGSKGNPSYREALTGTFPYVIVYKLYKEQNEIFITSIHHVKKHPKKKYRR